MGPARKQRTRRVPPRLPPTLVTASLPRNDLVDDALLRGLRFESLDLSARTARLVDLDGCHLRGTNLAGGTLDKVTVVDSVFDHCDLANLTLAHSSLARVELTGCRATGATLSGVLLRQVTFRECLAEMSTFRFATLTSVAFVDCRLQRSDFVSADLTSAVFRRCDLTGAELSQGKARGALFVDCVWDGVRGISSLAGATVVHGSPLDAHAFMVGMAGNLGILLGDPEDFPDDD
jgi:uncharacterized protein YjbI with pentapeptide repeats